MAETNIPVTEDARRALRTFKSQHDETYSEAIERLLDRPPREFQVRFQELDNDRPHSLEFVEVENADGESISLGEWDDDGEYRLLVVGGEDA